MIAGPDFPIDRALSRLRRQRFACQNIIEPPADIALTHPPPRRPPGEKIFVIRIERAPNVHQPLRQKPLEYFPLIGPLADQIRISLLRMNVPLGAGDVDVSTDNESRAARALPIRGTAPRARVFRSRSRWRSSEDSYTFSSSCSRSIERI